MISLSRSQHKVTYRLQRSDKHEYSWMASKLPAALYSDLTKAAGLLGFLTLYLDNRAAARAHKWHEEGEKESARRHEEKMAVLREVVGELKRQKD